MNSNSTRAAGFALLVGSIGFLITMGFHPTSGSLEGLVREAAVRVGTHSLGIASAVLSFCGFVGLYQRVRAEPVFAPAALIVHGFASVAAICAAVVNGLAAPAYAARMIGEPALHETARAVLSYSLLLNAGFARVFMVGVAMALLLWAVAIRRTRALPDWLAWLGAVLGIAGLAAVLGGFLGVGVREFGLFVLGYAAWTIAVGSILLRSPARP